MHLDSRLHLGFGAAGIGNLGREVTDRDAADGVDESWHEGVRYFDTAPHYGLGLSEQRLGTSLASRPRSEFLLSTKVGRVLEPLADDSGWDDEGFAVKAWARRRYDLSPSAVRTSIEQSLVRLQTDHVDIAYIHDPVGRVSEAATFAVPALRRLQDEGVVRSVGAGMVDASELANLVRAVDLDVVMIAGRFSLIDQTAQKDLLPECRRRGVTVVVGGVFNSGLLAREEVAANSSYDYAPADGGLLAIARRWQRLANDFGRTLPEIAVQFPLLHPAVEGVVLGAMNGEQARRNASLLKREVPSGLWLAAVDQGLIAPESARELELT